jgi:hypothetical protein
MIGADEIPWFMNAGCGTRCDWQFNPHTVEAAQRFLPEIIAETLRGRPPAWLPYGGPHPTGQEAEWAHWEAKGDDALPAFLMPGGDLSVVVEAQSWSRGSAAV